jgi:hypothetical protein
MMLLTVGMVVPHSVSAGTYAVSACGKFASSVNNSWQAFSNSPTYLETSTNCGGPEITGGSPTASGLAAADVLRLSTNVPTGALAGWRFMAPAGDAISAISMDRDLYEQSEGWVPEIVNAEGAVLSGETCSFDVANGGCEISGPSTHTGLDTASLSIELLCDPEPFALSACSNGFSEHDARVELDSATVTITDEQPPAITSFSGSLFAGGLSSGTLSGTIDGSDNSGVQFARLYVDGVQTAQQAFSCDFTQPAPCPLSVSGPFGFNTSNLSNGSHTIQAALIDAAGNRTLTPPLQINVENSPPSPPSGLQVNGQGGGVWVSLPATITWTNPSQPSYDPVAQINWVACAGTETSIPASGCDAKHEQTTPLTSLSFDPANDPSFADRQGLYTVFVWAQDAAGHATPANAAAITFGYQSVPPPPPTSVGLSGHKGPPYTIVLGAPAHQAPITKTHWIVCDSEGVCTPTQTTSGLSFVFDPRDTPQFQHNPYARYTVRAWLEDAAGNASPANSATLEILYGRPGKPSPALHILGIRRTGLMLRVRGSATLALRGHVKVVVHSLARSRSYAAHRVVAVARGRWSATLVLPAGALITHVTVAYYGSRGWAPQAVTRYFRRTGG